MSLVVRRHSGRGQWALLLQYRGRKKLSCKSIGVQNGCDCLEQRAYMDALDSLRVRYFLNHLYLSWFLTINKTHLAQFFHLLIFFKSALFILPRGPYTIPFLLYISMFLHDLSILPKNKNSCHYLIPKHRIPWFSVKKLNKTQLKSLMKLEFNIKSKCYI